MVRIRYVSEGMKLSFVWAAFEVPEEDLAIQTWRMEEMPRQGGRCVVLSLAPAIEPGEKRG